MAHVWVVGEDRRAKLARFRFYENSLEIEDPLAEEEQPRLAWKLLGFATAVLVSAGGWVVILIALRHFLH